MKLSVYQGSGVSLSDNPTYVLKHFGSMLAAARRLESKFSAQEYRLPGDDSTYLVFSKNGVVKKRKSYDELLHEFSRYMEDVFIHESEIEIHSPLRLFDCWEDDPVGSGGLRIFDHTPSLSPSQIDELRWIFHPFSGVIYPDDVFAAYSASQLKAIALAGAKIPLFNILLKERKARLNALGQFKRSSMDFEAVWVLLTLKLRIWSMDNGFDSWVYTNNSEGAGEDSYVLLRPSQFIGKKAIYKFNTAKYLDCVKPIFNRFLAKTLAECQLQHSPIPIAVPHTLWAGLDPLLFFERFNP